MLGKITTKIIVYLLKISNIGIEERNILTTAILDKLVALPIYDIIRLNDNGTLLIDNQEIDLEKAKILRESAISALRNQALKAVHDQVLFKAVNLGVHNVEKPEQMFFSRASIWFGQQEILFLKILAQQGGNVLEEDHLGN